MILDEFGLNLAMTRTHGRAPRGTRVVDKVPGSHWQTYTLVYGLRLARRPVVAPFLFPGAMTGDVWAYYVRRLLRPRLRRGDRAVFDDLGAHRRADARATILRRGARLAPLPPYAPDLSPIEESGSKVKTAVRAAGARTPRRLVDAVARALASITLQDALGYFRDCGYRIPRELRPL